MIKKAAAAPDMAVKRSILARVGSAATVDETRRAKLAAALTELEQPPATPSTLPSALVAANTPPSAVVTPPPPPVPVRTAAPHPVSTPATATATPVVATAPAVTKPATSVQSALEKAIEAAAEGRSADVRRLLEAKVRAGHGSEQEVRLVRKACSVPFDKACVEDIKAKYP
jgi:hypothetical protein